MGKFEKEIKILDVNVEEMKKKLEEIGAKFVSEKHQKIYVYDLPTIYYRYLEIKELIESDNKLCVENNINKLSLLLNEIEDLLPDNFVMDICNLFNISSFNEITSKDNNCIMEFINNTELNNRIKDLKINPNKWIRLRTDGKSTTLTCKHVFNKEKVKDFQSVFETEVEVSSFDETNQLLNSFGLYRRNFQEKKRYSYKYENAEIEIDVWPMINPYIEIECDDKELISKILKLMNISEKKVVSLNTEQLYKKIGVDIKKISELKF